MHIWSDLFCIPKLGNTVDEIEDASFAKQMGEVSQRKIAFALADGASEGAFCKWFAESLTQSFVNMEDIDFDKVLNDSRGEWINKKHRYIQNRADQSKPIQWFEEASFDVGAFSTLLGIEFSSSDKIDEGEWKAFAVGDTCLFQIRNDDLLVQFPIQDTSGFGNHPSLLSTRPCQDNELSKIKKVTFGNWVINDQFYLMTDALALWFMRMCETNRRPWALIQDLDTDNGVSFNEFIFSLRESHELKNDDTSLIRIDICPEAR